MRITLLVSGVLLLGTHLTSCAITDSGDSRKTEFVWASHLFVFETRNVVGTYEANNVIVQAVESNWSCTLQTMVDESGEYVLENDDENFFAFVDAVANKTYITKDGHSIKLVFTTLNNENARGTFNGTLVNNEGPSSDTLLVSDGKFYVEFGF